MASFPLKTSLSLPARLLCYLGPPSFVLLISIASLRTALLSPLAFLPTIWAYKRWRRASHDNSSSHGELEPMIWIYAATGTVVLTAAMLVQMGITSGVGFLLFGRGGAKADFFTEFGRITIDGLTPLELAYRAQLAGSWQNWIFNGILCYLNAGLVEEALKYLPIACARGHGTSEQRRRRNRTYIYYALTAVLSFGAVENVAFLYAACEGARETWPKLLLTLVERVVIGNSGHLLTAALTSMRAVRRDCYGEKMSLLAIFGPSALLHGTGNMFPLAISVLEGNMGWIHPVETVNMMALLTMVVGVNMSAAWMVRKEWKVLKERERRQYCLTPPSFQDRQLRKLGLQLWP